MKRLSGCAGARARVREYAHTKSQVRAKTAREIYRFAKEHGTAKSHTTRHEMACRAVQGGQTFRCASSILAVTPFIICRTAGWHIHVD